MHVFTGIDIVHIPSFAAQLHQPGTRFSQVFTAYEMRRARRRPPHLVAESLAGRWAAKEALVKAFSQALYGKPPVIAEEELDWSDIEVRADAYNRVSVTAGGQFGAAMIDALGEFSTSLSISHDGDYAVAMVVVTAG